MIFRKKHMAPILDGIKTQTRRRGKRRWRIDAVHPFLTSRFEKPFARARILSVREEPILEISQDGVHAEGYETAEEFFLAFAEINKMDPLDLVGLNVWVVEFEIVERLVGVHYSVVEERGPFERKRALAEGPGPGGRM